MLRFCSLSARRVRPLLRIVGRGLPGGNSLSFASPKESKQRSCNGDSLTSRSEVTRIPKGDPGCCVPPLRYGQPAVLGPGGVKNNSLRCASLKQVFALIRLALRSSAHPQGVETGIPNSQRQNPEYRKPQGLAMASPCLSLSPLPIPIAPSWLGRGAQTEADQGSRMFERSEFARDPAVVEHRRLPRSEA